MNIQLKTRNYVASRIAGRRRLDRTLKRERNVGKPRANIRNAKHGRSVT